MKITRRQLRRIIRERIEESPVIDAELNLEDALGQLLDAHVDNLWANFEATRGPAVPPNQLIADAGGDVMEFVKNWWKQQKETEGLPREDWE